MKYTTLTKSAKLALADIFVAIEEKFIAQAKIDDILLIKPDIEKKQTMCVLAKNAEMINSQYNPSMMDELSPYFEMLKQDFAVEVVYKFVTKNWDNEFYIRDSATIITDKLLKKVQDKDYQPMGGIKKKM